MSFHKPIRSITDSILLQPHHTAMIRKLTLDLKHDETNVSFASALNKEPDNLYNITSSEESQSTPIHNTNPTELDHLEEEEQEYSFSLTQLSPETTPLFSQIQYSQPQDQIEDTQEIIDLTTNTSSSLSRKTKPSSFTFKTLSINTNCNDDENKIPMSTNDLNLFSPRYNNKKFTRKRNREELFTDPVNQITSAQITERLRYYEDLIADRNDFIKELQLKVSTSEQTIEENQILSARCQLLTKKCQETQNLLKKQRIILQNCIEAIDKNIASSL